MLKQIKEAYFKFLQPYVHLVILFTGLLGLILTVSLGGTDAEAPKLQQFFLSLSSALLAGGIFAVIAKSHQLLGLFIQDIEKVIHSKEHYEVRNDKKTLWTRAMSAYHSGIFPEIEGRIVDRFDKEISCHNHDYYYKNAYRWLVISWENQAENKVRVEASFSGTIVPRQGLKEIEFKSITESLERKSREEIEADSLVKINNDKVDLDNYEHSIVNDMHKHVISYKVAINGETEFERKDSWVQDISIDSLVQFSALTYIDDLTLVVNFPKELSVVFNPYGVDEFIKKPKGITREQEIKDLRIERQFKELLFAEQGYILVLSSI